MNYIFNRFQISELEEFSSWLTHESIRTHIFIENAQNYYKQSEEGTEYRMYSVYRDKELIAHISGQRDGGDIYLCLIVKPALQAMGTGTELLRSTVRKSNELFGNAKRLCAYIYSDNPKSRRCFEKAGFIPQASVDNEEQLYIYDIRRKTMNETVRSIKERRSVRRYTSEMPPKELIDEIISCGTYAPSGMNRQSTIIIAITDKKLRDELAHDNAAFMGSDRDPFYGAPAVLVVLARKDCPTGIYDGSLVMSNLMLASHSLGISSCWIHRAKETFEMQKWKKLLCDLGVKGDYEGIGNCILGYCDGACPAPSPRNPDRVFFVE